MADDNQIEIKWAQLFKPMEGLKQGVKNVISIKRETVPIIFVPGIMGTRMKNAGSGDKVWDPDDALFMLWNYGLVSVDAADKKKLVVGKEFSDGFLEVFNDDAKHNKSKLSAFPDADKRGWGGVSWSSYGAILTELSNRSWDLLARLCFELPVHAFGYNWTASNSTAGKKLKAYIAEVIKSYEYCEKVILVTHSMGGLVARSATIEHGADAQVLGIIHGVQPVTGAAAAYWRMKAGFERTSLLSTPSAWVLGTNGEEVSALLGNLPGGLQLLPSPDYTDNDGSKQWLKFEDEDGKAVTALPLGDAFEEIYKNKTAYWRLINPAHLNPGSSGDSAISVDSAWSGFSARIDRAKALHTRLGLQAKVETKVFYGSSTKDNHTTDKAVYRRSARGWMRTAGDFWGVSWRTAVSGAAVGPWGAAAYLGAKAIKRTDWWQSRGGFKTEITEEDKRFEIELQPPRGVGDGTVPSSSGKALKGEALAVSDIEHEPAYQSKLTQNFTASCIEDFCLEKIDKAAK